MSSVGPVLPSELSPRDKSRDSSQSTAPRTQPSAPVVSTWCKTDLIPTLSSPGKVQSHLPSARKQEAEEQVSELPYLLSDLFYHKLQKRIQFWALKASLYGVEMARLQGPAPCWRAESFMGQPGATLYLCVYIQAVHHCS